MSLFNASPVWQPPMKLIARADFVIPWSDGRGFAGG